MMIINQSTKIHQKLSNLRNSALKQINVLIVTYEITLPQTYKGNKYVYLVWIRPTDKLQSQPRKGYSINEH